MVVVWGWGGWELPHQEASAVGHQDKGLRLLWGLSLGIFHTPFNFSCTPQQRVKKYFAL